MKATQSTTYNKNEVDGLLVRNYPIGDLGSIELMNANRELRRLYASSGLVGGLIFNPGGNDDQQIGLNIDEDYSGFTNYYTKSQTYTKLEVNTQFSNLINSAPDALNTLKELADALNNDANYAATVQNQLNSKANQSTTYKTKKPKLIIIYY